MKIIMDGRSYTAKKGDTILDVARRNDIFIPTLCHDDKLESYTACWLCVVKIKGEKRLRPACATRVADGMEIVTGDAEINAVRSFCIELLLSDHCGQCLPPCQLACPAGCDARGYIGAILRKDYARALSIIKETIPLPATIGRICPHPCETECTRNAVDEPLSICALKRFAADTIGSTAHPERRPPSGKRVAVVGAGPAGLSAAYFLALDGHEVTVFEEKPEAGGMLRWAVPAYRLPRELLAQEIDAIRSLGITVLYGQRIGETLSVPDLHAKGFHTVLIATGAPLNREMGIPGEHTAGVVTGLDFLYNVAAGASRSIKGHVAVIGGGDTAIDAARTALRLGAGSVSLIYRRTRNEMPASENEIKAAEEEGVALHFLTQPVGIIQREGRLCLSCTKMALAEPDASGRRRPVPVAGSEHTTYFDTVIMAIGQKVDTSVMAHTPCKPTARGTIGVDPGTMATGVSGVFAAGDCVTGPDIAVSAVAAGKRAAHAIDSFLNGKGISALPPPYSPARRSIEKIAASEYAHVERAARLTPKELDKRERRKSFREVEQTADVEAALHEAYRCLECGCGKVADCTLRDLAMRYGVEKNRFDSPAKRYQTDTRHPYIVRDPDKCIKCARCIRICHEVQGIGALAYEGRGFSMQAAPPFGWPLQDSGCESCGQCVTACPTGALTEKPVLQPSLSLFTELTTTVCAHCGIACGITVHTAGARIAKITPQNNANLCEKGKFRFAYLSNEERIVFPARKANGRLKRVSWDEAASIFSERVAPLDGRRIAVFVSPRLSSEDAFHAQKFARTILETNNLYPLATRTYLKPFLKKMLPFVSPSPIDACATSDAVVLVDPDTVARNEVAALNLIQAVRNGARLLIVGGKRTKLDTFAVHKLRVNPNRPELYRRALADFTRGARRPFLVYNRNCIEEKAIRQLHGYALKSGINIVSLTGEINEQGLLREGVSPFLIPGYEMLGNRNAVKRLEKKWKHGIPSWEGKRYTTLLRESVNGRIKAAVIFGDASVEDAALARALRRVPFVAAQTTRYTGLARRAHLILPVQSWIESAGTVTLYDGKKRRFKRAIPPLSGYTNREIMKLLASRIIIPRR